MKKSIALGLAAAAGLVGYRQLRKVGTEVRPVQLALANADKFLPESAANGLQKRILKQVYEEVSKRADNEGEGMSFLNYGFAGLEEPYTTIDLPDSLEAERTGMQLYHAIASAADMAGREVLEVGCGRGGGTSFVFDRFLPSRMVGIDLAERAIADCNEVFAREGLSFEVGDAENLQFEDESFDVVLNVESSHCYPNLEAFHSEVFRVLRPGGQFVVADLRDAGGDADKWALQLETAGFEIIERVDITPNVVKALELDTPRREKYIADGVPKSAQAQVRDFAGVVGTNVFNRFAAREVLYTRYSLRKP